MRKASDIEIMYQLSSRRVYEERSVALGQQCNRFLSLFGMTEEIRGHFTPRFVLTPYNGACGSDFLSNLNASRSARHLKVGLKAGQQPLGVSQTLKVSIQDYTSSATAPPKFWGYREGIEFADGWGNLTDGSKKIANGGVRIADGAQNFANGRLKWPGCANNLPMDAFKLPIVGLNCRWTRLDCQLTAQTARWESKTVRGRLNSFGEHEKWSGEGSIWPVSTSFDPGKAQTARGRVNLAGGAVNMRVLEISVSNTSRTERHLTVSQAMAIQPLGVFKTLKVSDLNEARHNIVISKRQRSERSVAIVQQCNRFLSSFGMTERLAARKKLTIKYNNPPSKRIAGTTKNAQFSKMEMGTRDNKLFPFFLISSTLYISSPVGGSPEGERGNGTVANINKASAYET